MIRQVLLTHKEQEAVIIKLTKDSAINDVSIRNAYFDRMSLIANISNGDGNVFIREDNITRFQQCCLDQ